MLFGLGALGCALLLTALLTLRSILEGVSLLIGAVGVTVGYARALRHSWAVDEG
jgi:hypothetical protein